MLESARSGVHSGIVGPDTVTLSWPPKRTGWFVPGITAAAPSRSPTKAPSNVTGFVPKAFESRRRTCRLQMSGRTISRND